MKNRKIREI